jgi:hypothetical protein
MKRFFLIPMLFGFVSTSSYGLSLCETALKRESLTSSSVVEYGTTFSKQELSMIQSTVLLVNNDEPINIDPALDVFFDRVDGRRGSLGGSINYYSYHTPTGREKKMAVVTYYPGDNEYGAIFDILSYGDLLRPSLAGLIHDGEVSCLVFSEPDLE